MKLDRREFLQTTGVAAATLSLSQFTVTSCERKAALPPALKHTGNWEDAMREKWSWDKTVFVTHPQDCYPGNCSWVGYLKNGVFWREEQTGRYPVVDPTTPDWNPRGCQKGCMYSRVTYGGERLKFPMKRVGPRGSGQWKRISWDEALTEVADAIIDAAENVGPESVVVDEQPGQGGAFPHGVYPPLRFAAILGGTMLDANGIINDYNIGQYMTFGKFHGVSSQDDWFKAELTLIWLMNPVYTRIPGYHFVSESRYNGGEVWTIAPDFSPSAGHADYYVPVKIGTDAALALGVARVLIEEKLYKADFVREQTDLAFLVRKDTRRFLRQSDLKKGGSDEQLYFWDGATQSLSAAPRKKLSLGKVVPELEGEHLVKLADGTEVAVTPVFEILKQKLNAEYDLDKVHSITGIHPDVIRDLARKMAAKRTNILVGWCPPKIYHGDLIERAMCLCLGLTGNWGRKGTGVRGWTVLADASIYSMPIREGGKGAFKETLTEVKRLVSLLKRKDPSMTDEMAHIDIENIMAKLVGQVPPAFFWYYHAGYREVWNTKEWGDTSMKRTFDEYLQEAVDKGWWEDYVRPRQDIPPQVYILCGSNTLRRTRGGPKRLLENLWPKLKMVVAVDVRMSTSAMYSDIVLPAAFFYEKTQMHSITSPHIRFWAFADKAIDPVHESKNEWDIFALLAKKVSDRARERGKEEYRIRQMVDVDKVIDSFIPPGILGKIGNRLFHERISKQFREFYGPTRKFESVYKRFTANGYYTDGESEKIFGDALEIFTEGGMVAKDTDLAKLRKDGFVKYTGLGHTPHGQNVATDVKPDETVNPFSWHTEKKIPYPTYARRAQFYIDHPWFIEGGEELPTHKVPPKAGGDYPFIMTSGHLRWSIHASNVANELALALHRGEPFMFINAMDAKEKDIEDGEYVHVQNDIDHFTIQAKVSALPRRGQVIVYHAWDPYQYKDWKSYDTAIPGMVKWLHLAGGYGHLKFWVWNWQPVQSDRHVFVDIRKASVV
ncbi:MAG: molybdopterin-dependent oxidoreductase [Nitrospirae bacterium]|nr:molybdopterin-dependent oxidoreductase [Nitrospirota bacterium]